MLHILLIILKIIGIVLLVILGAALLLVLLVLFVPVCYEAHLIKEESPFQVEHRAHRDCQLYRGRVHQLA